MNLKEKLSSQPFLKKFQSNKSLKGIVANIGWLFIDRILRMGVGLVVGVWVARYLGVEQFGTFNYATAFVALFTALSSLGLPALLIRTIANEPEKKDQILGTALLLQLFGGFISLGLSISTIFMMRHHDPMMIMMITTLSWTGIFQAFDTIDVWFQSQIQSKYTVVAKNISFMIITLIKVILIHVHAPLIAFAVANIAETIMGSVGLVLLYNSQGYSIGRWRWSFPLAKNLLSESYPLILSGLAIVVYLKIDQIMLGEMLGSQAVGLYSSAARVSEVWYIIPTAISASVAPAIYAAKNQADESVYYRRIGQLLTLLSWITILISVPMSLFSGTIINSLFGTEYADAAPILAIHIWASWFVSMGVGASSWFVAEKLTHLSFYRTFIGAVTNIILNFYLIPVYGGVGAATATLISYALGSVLINGIHSRSRKIFILQVRSIFSYPRSI